MHDYKTGAMDVLSGNKKLRLNIFNAITGPQSDGFDEVNVLKEFIEETIPNTPTQDLLQACLAYFDVDNFNIEGYMDEVKLELPSSTPPWSMKYEQMAHLLDTPIAFLLETSPILKQEPLLVKVNDPFFEHDATPGQETQLVGLPNKSKEAIEEIISDPPVDCPTKLSLPGPSKAIFKYDSPDNFTGDLSHKHLNCTRIDNVEKLSDLLDPP